MIELISAESDNDGIIFARTSLKHYTMKKLIALFIILPVMFSYCRKTDNDETECINSLIKSSDNIMFLCETGAHVDEYIFQGNRVYVFEPGNCGADLQAPVYDSNCNQIGALGGFIGNILINNIPFHLYAKFQKTIWRN
jgi:hypothetical protein